MDRVTRDPQAQAPIGPTHACWHESSWGHELDPGSLPAWKLCMYLPILSTPEFSEGCHNGRWQWDMIMRTTHAAALLSWVRTACGEQEILEAGTCKKSWRVLVTAAHLGGAAFEPFLDLSSVFLGLWLATGFQQKCKRHCTIITTRYVTSQVGVTWNP